ncbi:MULTISPECIES: hypothetical protein [unclassified Leptolyngbya]|uniref:hypothetical protein n=1 Tax=unclassified Leptolyngbya TaxID=2650499 RepID=UPI0016844C3D|nr:MULTISPECIES: hypothetical protein [unclassified Leptolyngbya]MBD1913867.1 hypothetical protein [Leptolyngbya sp. FACHB-8]MBD2157377.1 hypothetical protein [Leptolyngbya sp. FACHB-16]
MNATLEQSVFPPLKLEDYDIHQDCGFLPSQTPAYVSLPSAFQPIEQIATQLPKWMTTGKLRQAIANLPEVTPERELNDLQWRRAMLMYSYLTHAFVWGQPPPVSTLPRNLAVPFYTIAQNLGRPPVLSYASYALDNWVRIDEAEPIEIGNILIFQNFLGGLDEDWFILIHIDIEAKAAPALAIIPTLLNSVVRDDSEAVIQALDVIKTAWMAINTTMERMPEACDPYVYYNRVRPYIHGWKNNSSLPNGLIYEGVDEYNGEPQQLRGETGAQSAIVPTMDALFNISHSNDPLREFLMEMREYMPPSHRAFIEQVEQQSTLRNFVKERMGQMPELGDRYNDCVSLIEQFRTQHLEFAARYIHSQAGRANNDTHIGTGGTPFMQYLKKHRDESTQHLLRSTD